MKKYSFDRRIAAALSWSLTFVFASAGVAGALGAAPQADAIVLDAQARVTQGVIICPQNPPSVVSCLDSPAPTDSYDVDADLGLPPSSDFFQDIGNNNVTVTFAGTTCANIAANGVPASAFSLTTPPLHVDSDQSETTARFRGTIPFNPTDIFFPEPGSYLTHLEIGIEGEGKRPRFAHLHLDGNADLCATAPLAVVLDFSESAESTRIDQDSICIDIPSPTVDTLNISSDVLHACAISVMQ
jgi:hypothetical protein